MSGVGIIRESFQEGQKLVVGGIAPVLFRAPQCARALSPLNACLHGGTRLLFLQIRGPSQRAITE